jgi:hypothetical protein
MREVRRKLTAGVWVSFWDESPGGPTLNRGRVVRARGSGVLLERVRGGAIQRWRILRGDVHAIVPGDYEDSESSS